MIRADRCTKCGIIRVRSRRALEDATIDGDVRVSWSIFDPTQQPEPNRWELEVIRAGESVTSCGDHVWSMGTGEHVADLGRPLEPEDRIVLGADARASVVRRVVACTFAAQANAVMFAEGLRDSIDTIASSVDLEGPRLAVERGRIDPIKHPTLAQWAVRVRPRFRVLFTDVAEALLVAPAAPFWRVDLATTRTRLQQLRTRL